MKNAKYILVIFGLLFFGGFMAQDQVLKQKQGQLKNLEKEVNNLKFLIDNTSENQQASLGKYQALNELVSLRKRYIEVLGEEVKSLEYTLNDSEELIKALQRDVDSLKTDYAEMVYATSKMNHSFDRLFLIFSAQSYNQLSMRLKFLNQFAEVKKEQVQKIELVQQTLLSEKNIINSKFKEKKQALSKILKEKNKLSQDLVNVNKEYKNLINKEKELKKQLKQKEKEIKLIKAAIEEMLKKPEINSGVLSKNFAANKGKLPWPVKSTKFVSWKFGVRPHPTISGVEVNNLGCGIQTTEGAQVYAAFEGEVRKILSIPGSGQTVMVKHGDYFTVYGRLKNVTVKPGDKISTGAEIGRVMEVNGSNALDFQVWHKQENLNPQSWLVN